MLKKIIRMLLQNDLADLAAALPRVVESSGLSLRMQTQWATPSAGGIPPMWVRSPEILIQPNRQFQPNGVFQKLRKNCLDLAYFQLPSNGWVIC